VVPSRKIVTRNFPAPARHEMSTERHPPTESPPPTLLLDTYRRFDSAMLSPVASISDPSPGHPQQRTAGSCGPSIVPLARAAKRGAARAPVRFETVGRDAARFVLVLVGDERLTAAFDAPRMVGWQSTSYRIPRRRCRMARKRLTPEPLRLRIGRRDGRTRAPGPQSRCSGAFPGSRIVDSFVCPVWSPTTPRLDVDRSFYMFSTTSSFELTDLVAVQGT